MIDPLVSKVLSNTINQTAIATLQTVIEFVDVCDTIEDAQSGLRQLLLVEEAKLDEN